MSEIQLLCKISPDFKASRDIQTEYIKKYFSSTYGGTIGNYVVSIFGKRELINNTIFLYLCIAVAPYWNVNFLACILASCNSSIAVAPY